MSAKHEAPEADAVLLDLCRQWHKNDAAIRAVERRESRPGDETSLGRLSRKGWSLSDRLTAIESKTLAGVAAQAAVVRAELLLMHTDAKGKVVWANADERAAFLVLGHVIRLAKPNPD